MLGCGHARASMVGGEEVRAAAHACVRGVVRHCMDQWVVEPARVHPQTSGRPLPQHLGKSQVPPFRWEREPQDPTHTCGRGAMRESPSPPRLTGAAAPLARAITPQPRQDPSTFAVSGLAAHGRWRIVERECRGLQEQTTYSLPSLGPRIWSRIRPISGLGSHLDCGPIRASTESPDHPWHASTPERGRQNKPYQQLSPPERALASRPIGWPRGPLIPAVPLPAWATSAIRAMGGRPRDPCSVEGLERDAAGLETLLARHRLLVQQVAALKGAPRRCKSCAPPGESPERPLRRWRRRQRRRSALGEGRASTGSPPAGCTSPRSAAPSTRCSRIGPCSSCSHTSRPRARPSALSVLWADLDEVLQAQMP